jgi:hypothetical protein
MALSLFSTATDTRRKRIMETQVQRTTDPPRPQQTPGPGAPATYAAHAVRRDVSVRVSVRATTAVEHEELGEHGYGHGV